MEINRFTTALDYVYIGDQPRENIVVDVAVKGYILISKSYYDGVKSFCLSAKVSRFIAMYKSQK